MATPKKRNDKSAASKKGNAAKAKVPAPPKSKLPSKAKASPTGAASKTNAPGKKTAGKQASKPNPKAQASGAGQPKPARTAKPAATAPKRAAKPAARKASAARPPDVARAEARLFEPPTEGERADALRVLIDDPRLAEMASVGRYRVIAAEPLVVKPPHALAERRLIRVVVYDYAADRSVDACVDLDASAVTHLSSSRAQPMLAREEEAMAIAIAMADERVKEQLSLGDEPQVAMHYWSRDDKSLSYARRSAAVIFGARGERPSLVAVVDLIDNLVCEIVPAAQW